VRIIEIDRELCIGQHRCRPFAKGEYSTVQPLACQEANRGRKEVAAAGVAAFRKIPRLIFIVSFLVEYL